MRKLKVTLITGGLLVAMLVGVLIYAMAQKSDDPSAPGGAAQLRQPDSHVLDDGGADAVTIVEFLDFECPACGAFHPVVEDLREKYRGEITYVVRHFPLAGHANSTHAAVAAEAAAKQDRFEDMYHRLFETQEEWAGAEKATPEVFREYAEDLGLDMDVYDEAVADPATVQRVARDFKDGQALGVESTPTFFIDGEQLTLTELGDLEKAVAAAVDGG